MLTPTRARWAATLLGAVALVGGALTATAAGAAAASAEATTAPAATQAPEPDKNYQIEVRHTGMRIETAMASKDDLAPIVQGNGSTAYTPSHWYFQKDGLGYYRIINRHSNKCLNVMGASAEVRIPLVQVTCGEQPSERWEIRPIDSTYFTLRPRHTFKVAGVFANLRYPGAPLVHDNPETTIAQWKQFRLLPVS